MISINEASYAQANALLKEAVGWLTSGGDLWVELCFDCQQFSAPGFPYPASTQHTGHATHRLSLSLRPETPPRR